MKRILTALALLCATPAFAQTLSVDDVLKNEARWLNKTVTVRGVLSIGQDSYNIWNDKKDIAFIAAENEAGRDVPDSAWTAHCL